MTVTLSPVLTLRRTCATCARYTPCEAIAPSPPGAVKQTATGHCGPGFSKPVSAYGRCGEWREAHANR